MRAPREAQTQGRIRRYAESVGCICYKLTVPGRRGPPDLLLLSGPYALLLEVKRAGGRLSPLQTREIERLRAAGVSVYVVWTYEEAVTRIDEWLKR